MSCLSARVPLGDVDDVDAFVSATVRRLRLPLEPCEREELELEGVTLLYELHRKWDGRGTFSGYATSQLRNRLLTVWRREHGSRARSADGHYRFTLRVGGSLDELRARPGWDESRCRRMTEFARVPAA